MKNRVMFFIFLMTFIRNVYCQDTISYYFDFEHFDIFQKTNKSNLIIIKDGNGIFTTTLPANDNYFYYGHHSYKLVEYGKYNVGHNFIYQVPVWIKKNDKKDYHYLELELPKYLKGQNYYKINFVLGNMKTHLFKPRQYGIKFSPVQIINHGLKPLSNPDILFPVTSVFEMEEMNGIVYLSDSARYLYFGMFSEDTVLVPKKHIGAGKVKIIENGVEKDKYMPLVNYCADKIILDNISIKQLRKTSLYVKDIYFNFDKSTNYSNHSKNILEKIVRLMKKNDNLQLFIYGYTDPKGTNEYNKILSQRRANFIKNELIKRKISNNRLISIGSGELLKSFKSISDEKSRKVSFVFFE